MENLNFDILLSKIDELFEEGKTYKDESQTKSNARWKDTPVAGKSGPMRNKKDKQRDDRQKSKQELKKLTHESAKKKKKLKDACWDGYEAIGTKKKGGKEVPNCVPIKESLQEIIETPKGVIKLKLFKDVEWGEWQVKFLKQIGNKFVNQPDLAYHASDKEDAIDTLQQWASLYKQGKIQEGFDILPDMDRERYTEIEGLEGPFMMKSGKVLYYDPKEGKYYDRDSDMYLDYEDYIGHAEPRVKREARTFKGAFEILDEAGKCTGPTQKASSTSKGKKWMQCVKNPDGKGYKRVHWGQKGVRVTGKSGNTKRKKSFRARHKCSTAKAGTAKAQACKDW